MFAFVILNHQPLRVSGDATSGPYRPRARDGLRFGGSFMEPGMLGCRSGRYARFYKIHVFVIYIYYLAGT